MRADAAQVIRHGEVDRPVVAAPLTPAPARAPVAPVVRRVAPAVAPTGGKAV